MLACAHSIVMAVDKQTAELKRIANAVERLKKPATEIDLKSFAGTELEKHIMGMLSNIPWSTPKAGSDLFADGSDIADEELLMSSAALISPDELAKARKQMTAEEIELQRQSFAYGNTSLANDSITRETVSDAAEELKSQPECDSVPTNAGPFAEPGLTQETNFPEPLSARAWE